MQTAPHPQFYGWQLLIVLLVVYFLVIGCSFYGAPVMFPYMVEEIGWTRGQLSLGLTASMVMTALVSPLCAWSIKRHGARVTMFAGGLIAACGLALMAFIESFPLYIIAYGLIGTGACLTANIPIQTTLTHWFNRRRGTALGLVMAGASIGGFVAPLVLTTVIESAGGQWRLGWMSLSAVLLLAGVSSLIFVRNKPTDLGQHPDGIGVGENPGERSTRRGPAVYQAGNEWTLRMALRTPQLWMVLLLILAAEFVWQLLVSQGPLHLSDRGFTAEQYGQLYGLTIGLGIIGRLGAGVLVDRIEPNILYLLTAVLGLAGSVLLWLASPERPYTLAFVACSGVAFGAFIILWPTFIANYWGTAAFPEINGFIFPILLVSNACVAPLSGFIYDYFGTYLPAFVIAWVLVILAFFAALVLRPPRAGNDVSVR